MRGTATLRWRGTALAAAVGVGLLLGARSGRCATLLSDGFGDGDRDNDGTPDGPVENAADVGAAFFTARSNSSITVGVASDATVAGAPIEIGSGNALNAATTTTSNRPLVANFPAITLAAGDKLSLTFDARIVESPIDVNDRKFRFGLYNAGGTLVTDNNSVAATTDDDLGYFAQVDSGADVTGATIDVRGDNNPGAPNNSFLGGTGTNSVSLAATNGAFSLDDNDAHEFVLTLERVGSELNISLSFDGTVVDTGFTGGANPAALTFTYDEVALGTNGVSLDYRIDNVIVEYTPVPEPVGLALAGLAGATLLSRRGRRIPGIQGTSL
ncbi:MAG: hypothetical protein WBD40_26085 [Tepidisphaeraceae bacterium]